MWDYNDRVWGEMLGDYGPGELMAEWVGASRWGAPARQPMSRASSPSSPSPDAAYITGQTINVDGGLIMS